MATIGALVFEMSANVARLQQDMAKARSTVEGAMAGITSAANLAKGALGAIGVGASIAGFEQMIMGAIEGEAALHKLNLQTGISVELLSALRPVAKQSGTDIDTVAGMVNKLEKNMTSFAQTGGGKAKDAFEQLGYSQADVQKGLKNMDAFLPEFAKRLMETGVGGEQAGLAMQLMAKGGAAALPFLKQLVETGELHAKVTGDQAEAAHQFEVNLVKIQGASNALKLQLANAMLPTLNDITQAMVDARKAGDGFFGMMFEGAKKAMQAMMGWNTAGDLAKVNEQIVTLTDKWMGLEKIQGTRGVSAERVAGVKAELDALIAKRNQLEQIAQLESPAKKEKEENKALKPVQKKETEEHLKNKTAEYERAARAIVEGETEAAKETAEAWKFYEQIQLKNHKETTDAWALNWKQVFDEIDADQQRAIDEGKAYLDAMKKEAKDSTSVMKDLGFVMVSDADNAIAHWQGLRNLIASIAADMAKIIFRKNVMEPVVNGVSKWLGEQFGGGKASGGPVSGGTPYLVGEEGPELFVPSGNGTIVPNGASGGSGTVVQNITIHQAGATVQDMMAVLLPAMRGVARGEIGNSLRPGGVLA